MNLLRTLDPSNAGFPNGIRFATALALTLAWIAPAAFSQDLSLIHISEPTRPY